MTIKVKVSFDEFLNCIEELAHHVGEHNWVIALDEGRLEVTPRVYAAGLIIIMAGDDLVDSTGLADYNIDTPEGRARLARDYREFYEEQGAGALYDLILNAATLNAATTDDDDYDYVVV